MFVALKNDHFRKPQGHLRIFPFTSCREDVWSAMRVGDPASFAEFVNKTEFEQGELTQPETGPQREICSRPYLGAATTGSWPYYQEGSWHRWEQGRY